MGGDVIAMCAFGLTIDSFKNENNEFFREAFNASDFSGFQGLKFLLTCSFTVIMKLFKLRIFKTGTIEYMRRIVNETINYRKENKIIHSDMIQLVMQARDGNLKHSDSDRKFDDAGFATVTESEYGRLNTKMGLFSINKIIKSSLILN